MDRIGPYELLEVIGEGGMGRVYRARDVRYDRKVALKVMGEKAAQHPEFHKLFRREAELVGRMTSSHIVPIHNYGEFEGTPYLDMRFVDGDSLSGIVRKFGPATLPTALDIVAQAASALDDAHAAGIVHRDVKPGNLLIDRKGFCYLADFGIAVAASSTSAQQGRIVGSFPYMAPERFTDAGVTGAADTYALACVLYYAVTGMPPYSGSELAELRQAHSHSQIPSLRGRVVGVNEEIDNLLMWPLAKDPQQRPSSAGAWTKALKEAVARAGMPAAFSSPTPSPASSLVSRPQVSPSPVTSGSTEIESDGRLAWQIALLVLLIVLAVVLGLLINSG